MLNYKYNVGYQSHGRRDGFESGGGGPKKNFDPHFLASGGTKYYLDS